ncbi:MAG: protein-disulfide reductase DsbD [Piscirickettsiaceae bacterium CG_4_9_14_3_um_filter_43_564]|nr:protein-disulfide reductase DsbD [Thiomicrospira sp.]PIQ05038.1 MAG: cytochrome C biogenesis protein [Piscirickettsiaceae bacterium CG18_big_fil_WC_8_21_14_2_50_44_103]PIU37956.1 MAG: protein-disulfide reductase DsbD [Piscirickettsiaceae bacterium CG07_land_8_20_14_0_80_44_28]PIW58136.1 MAG: protein-disulfide reductase DsbD [Piscirickettsiaceae bacterium CG12_big_fil_rev_8_21_14_0_65_44_934]PIW78122.1 MAG: protein-disulfide reductase DsbD [Piscirickettsiaceae bacterium CG_4_8_14_3_um_filter_
MKTPALNFSFSRPMLTMLLVLLAVFFNPVLVKAENGAIADISTLNQLINQHSQPELLDIDDAFQLKTHSDQHGNLVFDFKVAEGYHLYKDKIKAKIKTGSATLGDLQRPEAISANDPVFGDVLVYHGDFQVRLPISNVTKGTTVEIRYQGCSVEAGVCYPPVKRKIELNPTDFATSTATAATMAPSSVDATETQQPLSETDQITSNLETGSVWTIVGSFFVIGLLLSLTPCVFPMIPILSSIIVGQGDQLTTRRAFIMSLVYVLAMSITYTAAGVMAGLFGENLQAHFQNPWIIGTFSLIFVLLAFSMFGFYELQLPSSLQSKLTNISNKQQGGTLTGVAVMGFLSALIVGPCMAPPLAGSLIYIGQTGDALLGGTALFAMSIGMGIPLLLLGTSAGKLLPRAGAWMDNVKAIFGVLMIGVAIWMAERILPEWMILAAWASLLIGSAVYLGALEPIGEKSGWHKLAKSIGIIFLIYGTTMFLGLAGGSSTYLQPLKTFQGSGSVGSSESHAALNFQRIGTVDELNAEIAKGNPIMLDFYADWCISCKEMESFTFSDPAVQQALSNVTLLQADVTKNNANDKELMKALGIVGPPAIMFFNEGQEKKAQRVVGFQKPEAFLSNIQNAFK